MPGPAEPSLIDALRAESSMLSVELRPPRAELDAASGMDAWIDTYHAVRGLVRGGSPVFLTDSAVGAREENNLRHLVINLSSDVPRSQVVPFLTTKHTLDYCVAYAQRAWQEGFQSLVILGGDKHVGPARNVEHAWQLREVLRQRVPELVLGGWANPHGNPASQAGFLLDPRFTAEYFLTQVVSHHDREKVEAFLAETSRRGLTIPGVFGVFYYRSANRKTLETLRNFLPVPVDGLMAEFAEGVTPDEICARTIRMLRTAGARHVYVSNLPVGRAHTALAKIKALV